jgi:putative spermidine/putrescine transport system permease protein
MNQRVRPGRIALVAACVLIGAWLTAPTLVVIPMSFTEVKSLAFPPQGFTTQWYSNFFTDPLWHDALITSLKVAALVTPISVALGTAAAFGLVRGRFLGKGIINGTLLTPIIVPVVVVAIGLFAVYLKWRLAGTLAGFVLAHTALALPFVVVTVGASVRTLDRRLELAAANLGAGPWTTFWTVTLPLIRPGVVAGALFAFITSFDEIVVSLFLQSPSVRTLPVQMFSSVTRDIDPTLAAAASMIIVFTTSLILLSMTLRGREQRVS